MPNHAEPTHKFPDVPLAPGAPRRMYISNIAPIATDEEIASLVRSVVPYRRIRVIRNMRHGLCARFAFVDINPEDEQTLRARLDGARYFGRPLGVLRLNVRPDTAGPDGV